MSLDESGFESYIVKMHSTLSESEYVLQISLEFYQKKRGRWPFPAECIPWEVWTVKLDILTLNNESGRW